MTANYDANATSKIYYQSDCNLSLLDGKTIAIIITAARDMLMPLT